jgi:aryl-alcohol dehydrogenase-like predicted oxidoreductase
MVSKTYQGVAFMKLRTLGSSDLQVSPIGLGCWQFSKGNGIVGKFWSVLKDENIKEIVQASLDNGINWCDTAEVYGWGASESALASALASLGKDVLIATKWWPAFRTANSIPRVVEEQLQRLKHIDLYQVHQPFGFSSVEKEMDALARLVEKKKIRYIGVSNFSANKMRRADVQLRKHGLRLVSNQVLYNLLDRDIESNGVMERAKELGVCIIAYSPLKQGILTGRFHDDPGAAQRLAGFRKYFSAFKQKELERTRPLIHVLKELAQKYNVVPAQIALAWLISDECVVAIPGASSPAQAVKNAASMEIKLSDDEMHLIDETSKHL